MYKKSKAKQNRKLSNEEDLLQLKSWTLESAYSFLMCQGRLCVNFEIRFL